MPEFSTPRIFKEWERIHWGAASADCASSANDEAIPTNPGVDPSIDIWEVEQGFSAWAIRLRKESWDKRLPQPNLYYDEGPYAVVVWYIKNPVLPRIMNYEKVRNLWFMIYGCLISSLSGDEVFELEDPVLEEAEFQPERFKMNEWRNKLKELGLWDKNHLHGSQLSKGGLVATEAQIKARQENVLKGRDAALAAKKAKADEEATRLLAAISNGADTDEIAEMFGIHPDSVKSKVHRARKRLNQPVEEEPTPPQPAPAPSVPMDQMSLALRIIDLDEQGLSPDEIGQKLGMPRQNPKAARAFLAQMGSR